MHILQNANLRVGPGELVCLLGGNASGKSTTMKTILGAVRPTRGTVEFEDRVINDTRTARRIQMGLAVVPENRRVFPRMTIRENLEMGAFLRSDRLAVRGDLERVLGQFPRLRERLGQQAGTLSGGEQQMLAMARALMSRPRLLLMDEPSMGLSPALVERNFRLIQDINRDGVTVFMVEQNAAMALSIAHRGYVLRVGEIVMAGAAADLLKSEGVRRAYLGEL
jgi:branched-chain amino acid transport system ATP-binding protein